MKLSNFNFHTIHKLIQQINKVMKQKHLPSKLIILTFILISISIANTFAQQVKKISVQGFLKDGTGKAVADGPKTSLLSYTLLRQVVQLHGQEHKVLKLGEGYIVHTWELQTTELIV